MKKLSLAILMLLPLISGAQNSVEKGLFSMWAQLRTRGEYRNGALFPRMEGEMAAAFINNRARLTLSYQQPGLELKFSGQHVGVWGQNPPIDKEGRFMLNEAWAKLKFRSGLFAQLGRQALSYDDERLLGGLDWNVSGRFHDLLKLGYEKNQHMLHLVLAYNQNGEKISGGGYYAPGAQPYKSMQTLWYHYGTPVKPFNLSLLLINSGFQSGINQQTSSNEYMQTFGTYATHKAGRWDLNGAAYYQTGKNRSGADVSAFMTGIMAKWSSGKRWTLGIGSDYLSGNAAGSTGERAFDPLYGTHHKFYGTMDYFYASAFKNSTNPGLWDNMLIINHKSSEKVDLSLNYHYFSTARNQVTTTKKLDKYLGSEFDLQLNWSVMPDVKLVAGYSFMLGTESMDFAKGGNHNSWQDWGWISLNITPRLFTAKRDN